MPRFFYCQFCNNVLESAEARDEHEKTCDRRVTCPCCQAGASEIYEMNIKAKYFKQGIFEQPCKIYSCSRCGNIFRNVKIL